MVTIVAAQAVRSGVVDEGDVAVRTVLRVATLEAEHPRGEAAAVQEQDRLAARRERLGHGAPQGCAQHELAAPRCSGALLGQVDDLDSRQRPPADPVRQHQPP